VEVEKVFGAKTGLSPFARFLTGYFMGDSIGKLKKGYEKERVVKTVECLHKELTGHLKSNDDDFFIKPMMNFSPNITLEIVDGVGKFFLNITKIKTKEEIDKFFPAMENVTLFINTVHSAISNIVKYVDDLKKYKSCKHDNRKEKDQGTLDKKLEEDLTDVKKSTLCDVKAEVWIEKMIVSPELIVAIKEFWSELMKSGNLEKKWRNLHFHEIGKSAGHLVSRLIRPACKKSYKKSFMKKWKKRLLKK